MERVSGQCAAVPVHISCTVPMGEGNEDREFFMGPFLLCGTRSGSNAQPECSVFLPSKLWSSKLLSEALSLNFSVPSPLPARCPAFLVGTRSYRQQRTC